MVSLFRMASDASSIRRSSSKLDDLDAPSSLQEVFAFAEARTDALRESREFFRKLAAIEQAYGTQLSALAEKSVRPSSASTREDFAPSEYSEPCGVASVLVAAAEEAAQRAQRHLLLAKKVTSEVVVPLSDESHRLEQLRKTLVSEGQRDLKALQDAHAKMKASQTAFDAAQRVSAEEASRLEIIEHTPRVKDKERKRARDKWEAAEAKLATSSEALSRTSREAEEAQRALFDERLPELLGRFEREEVQRATVVLEGGGRFVKLIEVAHDGAAVSVEALRSQIELADVEMDQRELRQTIVQSRSQQAMGAASIRAPLRKGRMAVCTLSATKLLTQARWRRRLCLLVQATPPTLFVYRAEDSAAPEEAVVLDGGSPRARLLHPSVCGRAHVLEVLLSDGSALLLQALDDDDARDWCHACQTLLEGRQVEGRQVASWEGAAGAAAGSAAGGTSVKHALGRVLAASAASAACAAVAASDQLPPLARLYTAPPSTGFPTRRLLTVSLVEAKRLPRATEYSCRIVVDDVRDPHTPSHPPAPPRA